MLSFVWLKCSNSTLIVNSTWLDLFLNKKFRYKRASPSFISHLCGRCSVVASCWLKRPLKNMPQNFIISPQQYKISSYNLFNKGYSEN